METHDDFLAQLDFVAAENSAARLSRGITSGSSSLSELTAIAQKIIGYYQIAAIDPAFSTSDLLKEEASLPLVAAARILHDVSQLRSRDEDEESLQDTHTLALMSAAAAAMVGNFSTSMAVLRDVDVSQFSPEQLAALVCYDPSRFGEAAARLAHGADESVNGFITFQNAFLETGEIEYANQARESINQLLRRPIAASQIVHLRNGRLALQQQRALSVARALKECSAFSSDVIAKMTLHLFRTLLPPQYRVLASGFLTEKANALITLPTSTGKTLLAELALLHRALGAPGVGLFIAPYVTIVDQALKALRPIGKAIGVRIDSAQTFSRSDQAGSRILVATPEAVAILLRSQLNIDSLHTVVVDEAHLIESAGRGGNLESLLIRMRLRQKAGNDIRLILLSAVLSNSVELRNWLDIPEESFYSDSWRPTARRVAIWQQDGRLRWIHGDDPLRPASQSNGSTLGERKLPLVAPMQIGDEYRYRTSQLAAAFSNIAYLVRHLIADLGSPVLAICAFKPSTRGLARQIATSLPERPLGAHLQNLSGLIDAKYPNLSLLSECLKRGVAYHNASLPRPIRRRLEDAIRAGELIAVVSTTTLAEGADFPFRAVVVFDWLYGYGTSQRPMTPLMFRNIAGRAGRAGSFPEGDTVVFDNVIGPLTYTHSAVRKMQLSQLYSALPNVTSAYANADDFSRRGIDAAHERNFVAAIRENPTNDDLGISFEAASFSGRSAESVAFRKAITEALNHVLRPTDGNVLGVAASPIKLTAYGEAVFQSGLCASSAKLLSRLISAEYEEEDDLIVSLMVDASQIPEQIHRNLSRIVTDKNTKQMVRNSDLAELSRRWRSGDDYLTMFLDLPKVKTSTRHPSLEIWLNGSTTADSWDSVFEKFIEFVEIAFGSFLPMMLRAAAALDTFPPRRDWLGLCAEFESRSDEEVVEAADL